MCYPLDWLVAVAAEHAAPLTEADDHALNHLPAGDFGVEALAIVAGRGRGPGLYVPDVVQVVLVAQQEPTVIVGLVVGDEVADPVVLQGVDFVVRRAGLVFAVQDLARGEAILRADDQPDRA